MLKIGIIGNGKMAVDCMKYMLQHEEVKILFAIYQSKKDPQLAVESFSQSNNIESSIFKNINAEDSLAYINSKEPDYIFSINNYRIIGSDLLKIPKKGIINFHNGPLPRYGGVHISSWPILNGEKEHGITWHFVNEGIDTGDIIAQSYFQLDEDITAARLMTTSISKGFKLFKEFFPGLLKDEFNRIPQAGLSSYFSLKDLPENNGAVKLSWDYEKISCYVRGLNYFPYSNDFVYATINHNNKSLILNEISIVEDNSDDIPAGKIVKLNESEFHIACSNKILSFDTLLDYEMEEIVPQVAANIFGVKTGDIIS